MESSSKKKFMLSGGYSENLIESLRDSAAHLKEIKVIAICAMMIAVAIIVNQFSYSFGGYIRIGFTTHVNQVVYMLFGGTVGMVFGAVADVVKFLVKPEGVFRIEYTLNSMLAGLIYGMFYYKRKMTFLRILTAQAVVALICNIIITTYLLVALNNLKLEVILIPRIIRNVVMLPINAVIFHAIAQALERAKIRGFLQN